MDNFQKVSLIIIVLGTTIGMMFKDHNLGSAFATAFAFPLLGILWVIEKHGQL